MTSSGLAVLACGVDPIADDALDALAADGRRAVVVPAVAGRAVAARTALPTPYRLLRVARSGGRATGAPGPWPLTSCVAVPVDLLEAVGGPDPRYRTAIGWADLVIRLRHVEPTLDVVDAAATVPGPIHTAATWRADGFRYAANRRELAWRVAARLLRSTEAGEETGVRQLRPRG